MRFLAAAVLVILLASVAAAPPARAAASPAGLPPFPAGWKVLEEPISWANYTLPGFPGTDAYVDAMDTPVVTRQDPDRSLSAYYVNGDQQLVALDLETGRSSLLHSWPTNLTDSSSPSDLLGYQDGSGEVTALYEIGTEDGSSRVAVAWFSLTNQTYRFAQLPVNESMGSEVDSGAGVYNASGWVYWVNDDASLAVFDNIYSGAVVSLTMPALPAWNSPVLIPTAGQIVEDVNDPSTSLLDVRVIDFHGGVPSYLTIESGPSRAFSMADANNLPYVYNETGGVTTVYGIGAGNGAHVLVLTLHANLSRDAISWSALGQVGTLNAAPVAVESTSGYYLNGAPAQFQAPFMNPVNSTVIYASTSAWFNAFVRTTPLGFYDGGPWTNSWEFLGTDGYENAILFNPNGSARCGVSCTLLVYWLPGETTEFTPTTPPVPYAELGLAIALPPVVLLAAVAVRLRSRGSATPVLRPRVQEVRSRRPLEAGPAPSCAVATSARSARARRS